jgi:hypothetical protein
LIGMVNRALARVLLGIVAIGAGSTVAWSQADQPRLLETVFQWRALAAGPPDKPVCYVTHLPEAVVQAPGQRAGPRPMLAVAWRPAKASANVVTVFSAYRFKAGSEAILEFAPRIAFKLYTVNDTAWAWNAEDDAAIVQAMRQGFNVTLRGINEADATVSDTFSLTGFTAAAARAIRTCPPR